MTKKAIYQFITKMFFTMRQNLFVKQSSALLIIDSLNTYANLGQTENTSRFKDFAKRLEGWNSTLLYKDDYDNQIIESVIPKSEEIVLTKTTDSELHALI